MILAADYFLAKLLHLILVVISLDQVDRLLPDLHLKEGVGVSSPLKGKQAYLNLSMAADSFNRVWDDLAYAHVIRSELGVEATLVKSHELRPFLSF